MLSRFTRTSIAFFLLLSTLSGVHASGWDGENDPENMAKETKKPFEYGFDALPLQGSLTKKPWADTYWPTYQRGLSYRWQGELAPVKHADEAAAEFKARKKKKMFFTERELMFMSEAERNKLSPAEKYDIINNDFEYTLTKAELARTSADAPTWEGICHGWAPAAMHFDEPSPCKINFGGQDPTMPALEMPFATSDIKGLLSLMQGEYNPGSKNFGSGTRCEVKKGDVPNWETSPDNNDINAGAFHVILANRLGLLNKGFVFDRTTDEEVWNQPVEGFSSKVVKELPVSSDAAPGTVKEVQLETIVKYTVEVDAHPEPLNKGSRMEFVVEQPYEYILELDQDNKIIGGKWITKEYPDFVWSESKANFKGMFKNLRKIYNASTHPRH